MKNMMHRLKHLLIAAMLTAGTASPLEAQQSLYGFTPFPPDLTLDAVRDVQNVIDSASTIYAIHLDQCLPWRAALNDQPYPESLENDWRDMQTRIPAGHKVYIATTPTDSDRYSLAPECDGQMPAELAGRSFDDPLVIQAYTNYVRHLVAILSPDYLNLGIEISELSLKHPEAWPAFATLFDAVYQNLKADRPEIRIGAEFVLQSLTLPRVAEQVKPLIERSDYLGLSFYPYGSDWGVIQGAPPLPDGRAQWLDPLDWVRGYTQKPIAITETGYLSRPIDLNAYGLHLKGDETTQADFVRDLVQIANRDRYLFVVWFVPIDYDRLYAKLPADSEGLKMWLSAGLFDQDNRAKSAWQEWAQFATTNFDNAVSPTPPAPQPPPQPPAPLLSLGFDRIDQLPECSGIAPNLSAEAPNGSNSAMHWSYTYDGDWAWCTKSIDTAAATAATRIVLSARSDRSGPMILRLDEAGGEVFYTVLWVGGEWRETSLQATDFSYLGGGQGNGVLDLDRIAGFTIADAAGVDGTIGGRALWLAGFALH